MRKILLFGTLRAETADGTRICLWGWGLGLTYLGFAELLILGCEGCVLLDRVTRARCTCIIRRTYKEMYPEVVPQPRCGGG